MNKISITTFINWTENSSITGVSIKSVELSVVVDNTMNEDFYVSKICISIKHPFVSDILEQDKIQKIIANSTCNFKLDVKHMLPNYKSYKKFTVKITSNTGEIFESEEISTDIFD